MFKYICSIILMLGLISSFAYAAKLTTGKFELEGESVRYIRLTGVIKQGDTEKFERLINKWENTDTPVEVLFLNSRGGDVDTSYELVDSVIDNDLITIVLPTNDCISACVAVYAAGTERILYPESVVGVHRAHTRAGDTDNAKSASVAMMEVYKDLDVPRSIRLKMIETPPDKVYYLTTAEKKAFSSEQIQFTKVAPVKNDKDLNSWILGDNKPVTAVGDFSH